MYVRARGSPIEAPAVGFRNTTPPSIEAELRQRCGYYIHIKGRLRYRKEEKGGITKGLKQCYVIGLGI